MVELLKRNTLADHKHILSKNKRKILETLLNLPVPQKRQKLSGRVGKGNKVRKYFTSIQVPKILNMATNFHNKTVAFKNKKKIIIIIVIE